MMKKKMSDIDNLTREKIHNEVTSEIIKPLQIIVLALTTGVLIFLGITLFLYSLQVPPERVHPHNIESFYQFLLIFGIGVFGLYLAFFFVSKNLNTKSKLESLLNSPNINYENTTQSLFGVFTMITIIKMAILEGAALFGLVILFSNINNDVVFATNDVWIGLVPTVVLVVMAIYFFPTKEKVVNEISSIAGILSDKSI